MISSKRTWRAATILAAFVAFAPAEAMAKSDPMKLYGGAIEFDVYREGDPVGTHHVLFRMDQDDLVVDSRFELKIKVLFFTAYAYLYRSEARWQRNQLETLKATVDDNGALFSLVADRRGDSMVLDRSEETDSISAPIMPTNHWNAAVLNEKRVLNTLTGRENHVAIIARGTESVPTERGPVTATLYAYTGDLENEVWYDAAGRWVKMRFKGTDGSTIEYVCRRCQGPVEKSAVQ